MDRNQELKWRSILRVESFETGSGRLWHKALSSSLSLQADKVWCVILPVLTTVPYPRKGLPLCGEPLESPAAAEIQKWSWRSAKVHSFPLPSLPCWASASAVIRQTSTQGLAILPRAKFRQAPLTVHCGRCVTELTHFLLCSSPTLKPTVMTAPMALFVEQTV